MSTTTHTVVGMTCAHCVKAVTDEIAEIDGVTGVDVDLASGEVTIAADEEPSTEAVAAAVDAAGYRLAP